MTELIEYRVIPTIRYMIARYEESGNAAGSQGFGTFDRYDSAHQAAYALAKKDQQDREWPVGDPRIKFPLYRDETEVLLEYIERKKNENRVPVL